MCRSPSYTVEFEGFRVTATVHATHSTADPVCGYTTEITISPTGARAGAGVPISRTDVEIRDGENETFRLESVEQVSSEESHSYLITVSDAPVRQSVDVTCEFSGSQHSHTGRISLPRKDTLAVLCEFSDITDVTPQIAQEVYGYIGEMYSCETHTTAASRFLKLAKRITPPERYLLFHSAVMQSSERMDIYVTPPSMHIARAVFELQNPRVYPDRPSNWCQELVELAVSLDGVEHTTVNYVTCLGLSLCASRPATARQQIYSVLTESCGEKWPQQADISVLGLALPLLCDFESPLTVRDMASRAPAVVEEGEYEDKKSRLTARSGDRNPEEWATLLPTAADRSHEEFMHVIARTAYQRAGKLTTGKNDDETPARLYSIAARLLRLYGSDELMRTAHSRSVYIRGLQKQFSSQRDEALDKFTSVLSFPDEESDNYDTYAYPGALKQFCAIWSEKLSAGDFQIDAGIESVREVRNALPVNAPWDLARNSRYASALSRLDGLTAELMARKLLDITDPKLQAARLSHASGQLDTAIEQYDQSDSATDIQRVESFTSSKDNRFASSSHLAQPSVDRRDN